MKHHRGFTLIELMIASLIVLVLASIALQNYQRYTIRARAASVIVEAGPVKRAIDEIYGRIDRTRNFLQLINATDGSIVGCAAPLGSGCREAGVPIEVIVTAEKLLLAGGTVRVSAGPCEVDCPSYALNFSSDLTVPGTSEPPSGAPPTTPPVSPPTPPVSPPVEPPDPGAPPGGGKGGGGGKGQGGGGGKGQGGGKAGAGMLFELAGTFVPSAHAANSFAQTNRMLYEFGEAMRHRAHASDNAACLFSAGTCTVTIKY